MTEGWQPMSSAPKDGTYILLVYPGFRTPWIGAFSHHQSILNGKLVSETAGWSCVGMYHSFDKGKETVGPTHWAPLLSLPDEEKVS